MEGLLTVRTQFVKAAPLRHTICNSRAPNRCHRTSLGFYGHQVGRGKHWSEERPHEKRWMANTLRPPPARRSRYGI